MGKTSNKNIKKTIIKTNNSLPINLKRTLWEGHQIKTLQLEPHGFYPYAFQYIK